MDRRNFLRRTSLALAGGLVVGPQVMEMYERMTHKKVFALGDGLRVIPSRKVHHGFTEEQLKKIVSESYLATVSAHDHIYVSINALNRYARV